MKQLEEQEQREEYLESIGDVKKQGNLDGFYRHLYDQKVCYEDKVDEEIKVESEVQNENSTAKRKISDDKNPDKNEAIVGDRIRKNPTMKAPTRRKL